jgi:hypothetical protein
MPSCQEEDDDQLDDQLEEEDNQLAAWGSSRLEHSVEMTFDGLLKNRKSRSRLLPTPLRVDACDYFEK